MSTAPRVSVVLPVRNGEPHLWAALRSVTRQTWTDRELIVIDDGSDDGTAGIVRRCQQRWAGIRLLQPGRVGLVAALNVGLHEARGDYIARMDADDLMHAERLAAQTAWLDEHPGHVLCGCLVESFPRSALLEGLVRYQEWLNSLVTAVDIARDIFVESPFAHPSVMMRKSTVEQVGGYRDRGWPEDYDLWLRFHLRGWRMGKVPRVLHFWRDRPDRLTRSDDRYALRRFRELKLAMLKEGLLQGCDAVQVWGAGKAGKVWARSLDSAGLRVARFIDIDPRKVGGTLRGAPVVARECLVTVPSPLPLLIVVGVKGARESIREYLDTNGFVEHRDYVAVA